MSDTTEPQYIEYALTVDAKRQDEAIARLQGRGIEYVWVDAPIETFVTEDGYGFQEADVERVTVRAYEELAEEITPDLLARRESEMTEWMGDLAHSLLAAIPQAVTEDPMYEFHAIAVRPGLVIRPPWDEERPEGETTMIIEPSAAFGTGEHPTTRHCLELIDEVVQPGDAMADLGAGSGILSILARKKGASPVLAIDLNPSADSLIRYHMELNDVEGIDIRIHDVFEEFADVENRFDLVAVNIGGKEAMMLADVCTRIVKTTGHLLLSGIVEWIEADVHACFENLGYGVEARRQGDEWVTLLLKVRNR